MRAWHSKTRHVRLAPVALVAMLASAAAHAHSASDAYLTLIEAAPAGRAGPSVIHAQWDIALRDLDFVLTLDDNGDGDIVWGELRRHQSAIAQYAYQYLKLSSGGKACQLKPTGQMVDRHADGAYASLMFDIVCPTTTRQLSLDYRLFFAIDPSHRAILVAHSGENIATAVLSSDRAHLELAL
jgi:hypothetical protein